MNGHYARYDTFVWVKLKALSFNVELDEQDDKHGKNRRWVYRSYDGTVLYNYIQVARIISLKRVSARLQVLQSASNPHNTPFRGSIREYWKYLARKLHKLTPNPIGRTASLFNVTSFGSLSIRLLDLFFRHIVKHFLF